jgi:hypothetical protein
MVHNRRSSRAVRWAVACTVTGVLLVSCGDDDDSTSAATTSAAAAATTASSGTATTSATTGSSGATTTAAATGTSAGPANEELCADREALATSVDALKDIDLVAEGTDGVKSAVTAVKDDLEALRASAGDELKPQVDAVRSDIDDLEAAIEQLGSGGASAAVSAVTSLVDSARTLLDELQAGACGETTTTT